MRTRQRRGMNRGFTLIELMVVITILGLLASITSVGVMKYLKQARIDTAKMKMRSIVDGIKHYRLRTGKIPQSIGDMCGDDEDNRDLDCTEPPKDPWNNDFEYTPKDRRNYDLVCLGADGAPGGEGEEADITLKDLEDQGNTSEKK
jgi:general secretion pathway protein G